MGADEEQNLSARPQERRRGACSARERIPEFFAGFNSRSSSSSLAIVSLRSTAYSTGSACLVLKELLPAVLPNHLAASLAISVLSLLSTGHRLHVLTLPWSRSPRSPLSRRAVPPCLFCSSFWFSPCALLQPCCLALAIVARLSTERGTNSPSVRAKFAHHFTRRRFLRNKFIPERREPGVRVQ